MNTENKMSSKQKQKLCIVIMAILVIAIFACLVTIVCLSTDFSINDNDSTETDEQSSGNASLDVLKDTQTYKASLNESLAGSLVVVNSNHAYNLPATELNLLLVSTYRNENKTEESVPYKINGISSLKLDKVTLENLHVMLTDLKKATGRNDTMISTGYKSDVMDEYSTGKLVALKAYDANGVETYLNEEINADIESWLVKNAYKYGFIQRYPEGKESITGVSNYTHCYRYVGVEHATYIKNNNLCLEEYVEMLERDKPSIENPLVIKASTGTYAVYYYESNGSSTDVQIPKSNPTPAGTEKNPYTVSATNYGGIIVTVKIK